MKKLITILLTIITPIFAIVPGSAVADMARGEQLHTTHCAACHASMFGNNGSDIYTRSDRRISNLLGLKKQVRFCEQNLGLTWFDDQIQDVTDYLNATFYKFEK